MSRSGEAPFIDRVLARLFQMETREVDPWLRDDYRQAFITLTLARKNHPQPFVAASYRMYGLHPDKVWPAIEARRHAMLRAEYEKFYGRNASPKKPVQSVTLAELNRRRSNQ